MAFFKSGKAAWSFPSSNRFSYQYAETTVLSSFKSESTPLAAFSANGVLFALDVTPPHLRREEEEIWTGLAPSTLMLKLPLMLQCKPKVPVPAPTQPLFHLLENNKFHSRATRNPGRMFERARASADSA